MPGAGMAGVGLMNIGRGLWQEGGVSHTHPLTLLTRQPWKAIEAPITLHKGTAVEL